MPFTNWLERSLPKRLAISGKEEAMSRACPARNRFALPMTAFCSWIAVGIFKLLAAMIGGSVG